MSIESKRILKPDKNFMPLPVDEGDEIYPNGLFHFNITKMAAFIQDHRDEFIPERIAVKDFFESTCIDESFLKSVQISKPVIIAEIAQGRYNVIDGNHRMEKARRMRIEHVMAYRLNVNQHIRFLTTQKAYNAYIKYWNEKVRDMESLLL